MRDTIDKELDSVRKLNKSGNHREALEICEENYRKYSEFFTLANRITYAWTIYHACVKNCEDENELFESVELICELVPQQDLRKKRMCPYTKSVFTLLDDLKEKGDFYNMLYWLDKINPEFLREVRTRPSGNFKRTEKEKYYEYASKTYYECGDYEECIAISREALETIRFFTANGDVWHRLRIARSLKALRQYDDALKFFDKVLEVKKDWYIYRDVAEIYVSRKNHACAMRYLCPAVLSKEPSSFKVNLYYLIYRMFASFNEEMAILHAKLVYLLKLESGARVPDDIKEMNLDESLLNKRELEAQIRDAWTQYKFSTRKLEYGTVATFFTDKNYGFIKTDKGSVFFHRNEFNGDDIHVGQYVSFYTEKSFDKSKNRKSLKAVNINSQ